MGQGWVKGARVPFYLRVSYETPVSEGRMQITKRDEGDPVHAGAMEVSVKAILWL